MKKNPKSIIFSLTAIFFIVFINSCYEYNNTHDPHGTNYIDIYEIGDTGPAGGIIFYDKGSFSDGWRWLESAPISTEWSGTVWGGYGTEVSGTENDIGTGSSNTEAIVEKYGNSEPYANQTDYAAKLCSELEYGGYSDWFLPSDSELMYMSNLYDAGLGDFSSESYWSSTEYGSNSARHELFGSTYAALLNRKDTNYRVRAARAF